MTREVLYRYLGTNGVIESPIHLEDTYYVRILRLTADAGKILTDGSSKSYVIRIPEEELGNWKEVNDN